LGRKPKKLFEVTGEVKELGKIDRHTYAYSEAQAIKQVSEKLKRENPRTVIFIKDAQAFEVAIKMPVKAEVNTGTTQLNLGL